MNDKDLLIACLEAFKSMPVAKDARKLLRRMNVAVGAYQGQGSHILAEEMARRIRAHLDAASAYSVK